MALLEEEEIIKLPVRSEYTPLDNIYIENPPFNIAVNIENVINHNLPT